MAQRLSCLCGAVTASYTSEETALEKAAVCMFTVCSCAVAGCMFGGLKLLQQSCIILQHLHFMGELHAACAGSFTD